MENPIELKIRGLAADDKVVRGLLLSTLSAIMSAMKQNSSRPLDFLLRERLKERSDRRLLNVMLNQLATQFARDPPSEVPANRVRSGRKPKTPLSPPAYEVSPTEDELVSIPNSPVGRSEESLSSLHGRSRIARLFESRLK
jgi:hypothetical protein